MFTIVNIILWAILLIR